MGRTDARRQGRTLRSTESGDNVDAVIEIEKPVIARQHSFDFVALAPIYFRFSNRGSNEREEVFYDHEKYNGFCALATESTDENNEIVYCGVR